MSRSQINARASSATRSGKVERGAERTAMDPSWRWSDKSSVARAGVPGE
jgi:hypothetical protein